MADKVERELVLPAGAVVLILVGLWIYLRRR